MSEYIITAEVKLVVNADDELLANKIMKETLDLICDNYSIKSVNKIDTDSDFKCEYLEIKETDYDYYSGHSSYMSYCNLIKEKVPVCGWRRDCNKEKKCSKYMELEVK